LDNTGGSSQQCWEWYDCDGTFQNYCIPAFGSYYIFCARAGSVNRTSGPVGPAPAEDMGTCGTYCAPASPSVTPSRTPSLTPTPTPTPTPSPSIAGCVCKLYEIDSLTNGSTVQVKSCCDDTFYSTSDSNYWKHSGNFISVCSCEDNVTVTGGGSANLISDCNTDCSCYEIYVAPEDIALSIGDAIVHYQCCDGSFATETYQSSGQYFLCAQYVFHLMFIKNGIYYSPVDSTLTNNGQSSGCNCTECGTTC
jgi:hypothetical protein